MRTAVARLRAAACAGLAVATMLTVAPVTAAASPSQPDHQTPYFSVSDLAVSDLALPDVNIPALNPDLAAPAAIPAAGLPTSRLSSGAQLAILTALTPPALLLNGAASLAIPTATGMITAAARVIADARSHVGARYRHGAVGPRSFDCIGLVLRSYAEAGVAARIGGWANRSGYSLYAWARRHHLTSRTHGQPGDVVVWGGGGHVGIYLGHGVAISALVSGVRVHGLHAVTKRFTTFIHTGLTTLQRAAVEKAATPARSIGIRHAGPSLQQRTGHSTGDTVMATLKAGTKLTLLNVWRDAKGRTWYRVNANRHVGWVAGWLTRA